MMCDVCKERESVVKLFTTAGDTQTQQNLCERCAAERGVEISSTAKHPLGDFLQSVQLQLAVAPSENGRCASCSSTLRDFRDTGRLGCAKCYISFETSLRGLLRKVHGNSVHVGHRYAAPQTDQPDDGVLLGELRDQLRSAIDNEEFERAAALRDKIWVLE
jgi:protein arginine kinase activator